MLEPDDELSQPDPMSDQHQQQHFTRRTALLQEPNLHFIFAAYLVNDFKLC